MASLILLAGYTASGALLALAAHIIMSRQTEEQLDRNLTDFFAEIGAHDPDGLISLARRRWLVLALAFLIGPAFMTLAILHHFKTRGGRNG
jgi:hypothetical protein